MNAAALIERTVPGLHPFLAAHLPRTLKSDSPILDVGCGTGAWLARLADAGYTNLDGTDRDVGQVAFRGARVFVNDLNDPVWNVGQQRYELITAIEIIEHLDNVGALLSNARRLLTDDGHLLVTTPNIESIGARLRFLVTGDMKHFGEIGDRTHVFPVLSATMDRLVAARGLRIVERFGYPESGRSLTARPWVNAVCTMLRAALPEAAPGDNSCFLIVKA